VPSNDKEFNIAGRQRMLSQRMAATSFGASRGVRTATSAQALKTAHDEFASAHAVLKGAPRTAAAIQAELELAEQQLGFGVAPKSLKAAGVEPRSQADVFTTAKATCR
jgi:hypothetical protein